MGKDSADGYCLVMNPNIMSGPQKMDVVGGWGSRDLFVLFPNMAMLTKSSLPAFQYCISNWHSEDRCLSLPLQGCQGPGTGSDDSAHKLLK